MLGSKLNVLVTGDTHLGGGRVRKMAISNSASKLFGPFLNDIQDADLSITNLESPLINEGNSILKTGPNLKSPIESISVLKSAGFNLLTLANNHIMDFGVEGLISTIKVCKKKSLATVGAGKDAIEASRTYFFKKNELRLSIINIAENEFGTTVDTRPGAHALHPTRNYYTIKRASEKADYVIVIIHGGHENYPLPSPTMKERYRYFIDIGASLVLGHHPHCYSGFEVYKGKHIYYSLGNFIFDKEYDDASAWNTGFMLYLTIDANGIESNVIPYLQNGITAGLRELSSNEAERFQHKFNTLSEIIADEKELENRFSQYCLKVKNQYQAYLEPHSYKYIHALQNRGMLPSCLSKRKKTLLLNLTRCESHRDVIIKLLNS